MAYIDTHTIELMCTERVPLEPIAVHFMVMRKSKSKQRGVYSPGCFAAAAHSLNGTDLFCINDSSKEASLAHTSATAASPIAVSRSE